MKNVIIFDLSDVYIRGLIGIELKIAELVKKQVSNEHIYNDITTKLFRGDISEDEYWSLIIKNNNWNIDIKTLKMILRGNMEELDGTREIIEALRMNKNYELGLLSVHAKEWVEYCEKKFQYHQLFDTVMYSYEIKVCKPELKAFEKILESMNANPHTSYLIDDSDENIASAEKLGIQTIFFENSVQLKQDLIRKGLLTSN